MASPSISPVKDKPSPVDHANMHMGTFLIPSPIVTRRTRTSSTSRMASNAPIKKGHISQFDRCKGHGFITPDEEGKPEIFCHVSDIEGEIIPIHGDLVTYKECPVPPKKTKVQAIEVTILSLAPGKHLKWEDPAK
ncbi:cold shock domain-containing protein CG9705-like [Amphiura filiformis]|uniref:cold shock domain-containing protein CG9705-like n=1 Tax=Amphiura filiformis TaxID=82378 RepID=UPI003B20E393